MATAPETLRTADQILLRKRDWALQGLLWHHVPHGSSSGVFQVQLDQSFRHHLPPFYRLPSPLPFRLLLPSNVLLQEAKKVQLAELLHRCEVMSLEPIHCNLILGHSCPKPGSIPNGNWSCQTQELLIPDATFLDSDVNTYPGEHYSIKIRSYRSLCQRFNAALTATLGMWPTRRRSLHVLMGNTNLKPGFDKSLNL